MGPSMGLFKAKLGGSGPWKDQVKLPIKPSTKGILESDSDIVFPAISNGTRGGLRRRREYVRRTMREFTSSRIIDAVPIFDGVHERLGISRAIPIGSRKSFASRGSVSLPQSTILPLPTNRSVAERRTKSLFADSNDDWDLETLLRMSDTVRTALREGILPCSEVRMLNGVLEDLLADENDANASVTLELISHARLDKLLSALTDEGLYLPAVDEAFEEIHQKAHALQHRWQLRFLANYFELDEARLGGMRAGRLHDMSLGIEDGQGQNWNIDKRNPIDEMEGGLSFEIGAWWVNLYAAFRDGIVGSPIETVTKGHYGVTALPMMTGTETTNEDGTVKLIRNGDLKDMYPRLLSQVGRAIRVLRGHSLRSKNAPLAGVRYDGLYKIKQYGHKLCLEKEIYQLQLTLERLPAQKPIDELQQIPMPSELDDWQIYMKLLAKDIRARKGDVAYSEWKAREEKEEQEREERKTRTDFGRQQSQVGWTNSKNKSTFTDEPCACEREKKEKKEKRKKRKKKKEVVKQK